MSSPPFKISRYPTEWSIHSAHKTEAAVEQVNLGASLSSELILNTLWPSLVPKANDCNYN